MGRRRKRLIVQADLTSEEDQAFLAWVEEKRQRRRLADEIREGLRLQYERGTGQAELAYPSYQGSMQRSIQHENDTVGLNNRGEDLGAGSRIQKLVQSL